MFTTTVAIKGTFDIAIARNLIRTQMMANQRIIPSMGVQTTIALTALGELIISMQVDKAIPVKLEIAEYGGHCYFEYSCFIPNSSIHSDGAERYQINLERVSHSFNLQKTSTSIQIEGNVQLDRSSNL